MNNIIQKLKDAGLKTAEEPYKLKLTVSPCYNDNFGFFHVTADDWSLIFLKGVFKDNIRMLNGDCKIEGKKLNELAQLASDAEKCLKSLLTLYVSMNSDDKFFIFDATLYEYPAKKQDKRDYHIPKPLTSVEMSLAKSDFCPDRYLFIQQPFTEIFPDVLSPFMMSVVSKVPDILNPLFMSSSIKTLSPSIKMLYGRVYMNMTNAQTVIPAFYQKSDFFLANFAQNPFLKLTKPVFDTPDDKDIKVSDSEIEEALKDISTAIDSLSAEDMFTEDFYELPALIAMAWEMVYIRLWKSFTIAHKMLGKSIDDTLRHIYKTRADSLLCFENRLHTKSDPSCEASLIPPLCPERLSMDELYNSLPAMKKLSLSRVKYSGKISEAHKYLHMRDELYVLISSFVGKLKGFLTDYSAKMVSDNMLSNADDIFCFEVGELKNIMQDEYFGNIPFTVNFRKWQNERYKALCMPYYVYEKDIENSFDLSQRQIEKYLHSRQIPCISLFHREIQTSEYAAAQAFDLKRLSDIGECEAVIAESASFFSYAAEYCAVKEIPLYTGVRYAGILLNSGIKTAKNSISF
jgi:hypothetical protein